MRLALDPHVTVLVGPSGSGKTAVIRALKLLAFNRPLGARYVGRWRGAPFALVRATVDGVKVSRKRGAGVNEYRVNGKRLGVPGSGVPQEVSDLMNLGPVNFQGQHDAPYWFGLPAPQVAKNLNEIVNLGLIDRAMGNVAARVRHARAAVAVSTERLADARRERDETAWAAEMAVDLDKVDRISVELDAIRTRSLRIASAVEAMVRAAESRRSASAEAVALRRAVAAADAARLAGERVDLLESKAKQLKECTAIIRRPIPSTAAVEQIVARRKRLDARHARLASLVFGLQNQEWLRRDARRAEKSALEELSKLKGTRCPLCQQTIRNTCL